MRVTNSCTCTCACACAAEIRELCRHHLRARVVAGVWLFRHGYGVASTRTFSPVLVQNLTAHQEQPRRPPPLFGVSLACTRVRSRTFPSRRLWWSHAYAKVDPADNWTDAGPVDSLQPSGWELEMLASLPCGAIAPRLRSGSAAMVPESTSLPPHATFRPDLLLFLLVLPVLALSFTTQRLLCGGGTIRGGTMTPSSRCPSGSEC